MDDEDSSDDSADDAPTKNVLDIDWKGSPELSEKLVTLIMETASIKKLPLPILRPKCFDDQWGWTAQGHRALGALGAPTWMAKITRDYNMEMGQTGAGIENAADIDMSTTNAFTTKWGKSVIEATCPWYFDMCNLIGQRPNLVPMGLRHSNTVVAPGVIIPTPTVVDNVVDKAAMQEDELHDDASISSVPFDWGDVTPVHSPDPTHTNAGSEDDCHPTSPVPSESAPLPINDDQEGEEGEEGGGRGAQHRGDGGGQMQRDDPPQDTCQTSKPAAPTPSVAPKASKKTKIAEFSEIAKNEEQIHWKEIELPTLRMCQQMKALEVKGRIVEKKEDQCWAKEEAKQEERILRLEMKKKRMENAVAGSSTGAGTGTGMDFSNYSFTFPG
ncbi:hypothetical protein C8F04DRAFT_1265556 [Mycena alexandri]|uniref:No apical meristem-associated C-terminal domain-containing protein n=1 Tax=Mycena alexandri TaxID=1745969 RepID=A0AAD6SKA7_9AGAR|nr:hypothetical protein C8F04DRAFT_1265556 [Mycena alexandri]